MADTDPDMLVIKLKRPLQLTGKDPVGEITLVEPTAGQIETALREASAVSSNIVLISLIAGISPGEVRQMLTSDFNQAVAFLSGFTQDQVGAGAR